jgi:hypothetical protein
MSVELISLALVILIMLIPYPIGYFYEKSFNNDYVEDFGWHVKVYLEGLVMIMSVASTLVILFFLYLIIHGILSN